MRCRAVKKDKVDKGAGPREESAALACRKTKSVDLTCPQIQGLKRGNVQPRSASLRRLATYRLRHNMAKR